MRSLRYNALALFQALIGFVNSALLLKIFGVSADSDAYFIGFSIFTAASLLPLLFIEQFMVFYHKIKVASPGEEKAFYSHALFLSVASGIFVFLGLNVVPGLFIKMFAASLDTARVATLRSIILIFSAGVLMRGVLGLMEGLFNAENRFSIPYLINSLPQVAVCCVQVVMFKAGSAWIFALPIAFVSGTVLSVVLGFFLLYRMGFPLRFKISHSSSKQFIKSSFTMRMGHNVHNFLTPIVINNILSALPVGAVSCYGYANRFISAAGAIITGPLIRVFYSRISVMWASGQREGAKSEVKQYLKTAITFFMLSVLCGYILIPHVLRLLASAKLQPGNISQIQTLFLALSVWYGIVLVESPFVGLVIISCDSRAFIATNSLFIAVFSIISLILKDICGIYTVPAGLAFAQTISTVIYINTAMKLLRTDGLSFLKRKGTGVKDKARELFLVLKAFLHDNN